MNAGITESPMDLDGELLRQMVGVAVAEERDRIAGGLNTTIIRRLFSAGLDLQGVLGMAEGPVRDRLVSTIDALDAVINEVRVTIFELSTRGPARLGLRARIVQIVAAAGLGFEPDVDLDGRFEEIAGSTASNLLEILGDMLGQVAIEASATRVHVSCSVGVDVVLTIMDNGEQVDDGRMIGADDPRLSQRARAFGGSLDVRSGPAGGTRATYRIPVSSGW